MKLLLCLTAALAILMTGCNSQDASNLKGDVQDLAKHTGDAIGSASVAGKVNTVLSLRKGVDMSGLHVEAKGSTVTLGGHVRNEEEHQRILDTVNGIRGVDKLIDKLTVK